MAIYRGVIESHIAIKSAKKGTPGIEFTVTLRERKREGSWVPITWLERRVWLYFPQNGDHSYSMKKLAFAGHKGGGLQGMDLVGNACEVTSTMETHEGKEREKFELALPGGGRSETSDEAFMAIDAIMQSQPVPDVQPAKADDATGLAAREPVGAGVTSAEETAAAAAAPSLPNDDVPF